MAEIVSIRPKLVSSLRVKPMINVGSLLDIPTGRFLTGEHGESILNGGLGYLTGVTGIGNQFKSTFMHYMMLKAHARMGPSSYASTYDTEINIQEWHLEDLFKYIEEFKGRNILDEGLWEIADKIGQLGAAWFDAIKDYMNEKIKAGKKLHVQTPFVGRDGKPITIPAPSFLEIDSLSEFVTEDVVTMQDDTKLGDSKASTQYMRQGLQKNRLLMEFPAMAGASSTYALMTAHLGDEFNMDPHAPPKKKLQYLQQGSKLKGVPEKFTFMMNNCWWCYSATPLRNKSTKAPEYPRSPKDDLSGDTDLCEVTVRQLRNKSGPSGMAITQIISQSEGVLPSLTEFHFLKENGRFGLQGDMQNYVHAMCPEIKLSRSVVRAKIDKHPELRRALNLSAEMLQMYMLWRKLPVEYITTPKELREDLIAMGYDFDELLKITRGWWAPKGCHEDKKFLSTMDFLRMRTGEYVPFWMSKSEQAKIDKSKAKPAPKYHFEMTEDDVEAASE